MLWVCLQYGISCPSLVFKVTLFSCILSSLACGLFSATKCLSPRNVQRRVSKTKTTKKTKPQNHKTTKNTAICCCCQKTQFACFLAAAASYCVLCFYDSMYRKRSTKNTTTQKHAANSKPIVSPLGLRAFVFLRFCAFS